MARPSTFTQTVADEICKRLAEGESLRSICRDDHLPNRSTVSDWVIKDTQGFANQYARARDEGLDVIAEETFEIADDGTNDWVEREKERGGTYIALNEEAIARSRIRLDQRKWYLSKLAPKRYGDRIAQEISNPDGSLTNLNETQLAAKLAAIQQAAAKRKADAEDDYSDLV